MHPFTEPPACVNVAFSTATPPPSAAVHPVTAAPVDRRTVAWALACTAPPGPVALQAFLSVVPALSASDDDAPATSISACCPTTPVPLCPCRRAHAPSITRFVTVRPPATDSHDVVEPEAVRVIVAVSRPDEGMNRASPGRPG